TTWSPPITSGFARSAAHRKKIPVVAVASARRSWARVIRVKIVSRPAPRLSAASSSSPFAAARAWPRIRDARGKNARTCESTSAAKPTRTSSGTPYTKTAASGHTTSAARTSNAAAVTTAAAVARAGGEATCAVGARAATRSAGREAAVDDQLGAGHERGLVAGQKQRDVGDLARPGDAAERDARLELLADRVGEIRRLQRRVDDAGVDHVAADLVLRELDGERL